jgi:hypothetical protein
MKSGLIEKGKVQGLGAGCSAVLDGEHEAFADSLQVQVSVAESVKI